MTFQTREDIGWITCELRALRRTLILKVPGVLVSRLKINERLHPRSVSNLFGDNLLRAAKTARKYLVLSMRVLGKQTALKVDLEDDDRGRTVQVSLSSIIYLLMQYLKFQLPFLQLSKLVELKCSLTFLKYLPLLFRYKKSLWCWPVTPHS